MAAEIVAAQNRAVSGADYDRRLAAFAGDHEALRNQNLKQQGEHGERRGQLPHGGFVSLDRRHRRLIYQDWTKEEGE
jgi:hypothetical protein